MRSKSAKPVRRPVTSLLLRNASSIVRKVTGTTDLTDSKPPLRVLSAIRKMLDCARSRMVAADSAPSYPSPAMAVAVLISARSTAFSCTMPAW